MEKFSPYAGDELSKRFPLIYENVQKLLYVYTSRGSKMSRILRKAKPSTRRLFDEVSRFSQEKPGYLNLEYLAQTFPVQMLTMVISGNHLVHRPLSLERLRSCSENFPFLLMFPQILSVIPREASNIISRRDIDKTMKAVGLYLLHLRYLKRNYESKWESVSKALISAREYLEYDHVGDAERERMCFSSDFSTIFVQDFEKRKLTVTKATEVAANFYDWLLIYS